MQKKNNLKFMLLVILLIFVIICVSSFGLVTWARYRSAQGSNVTAEIAKWSFKVNGQSEEFAEIDLADTISFEHIVDTKIAPGTYGSFNLEIDGTGSEVSLDYYVDINVQNKPTNMKFYSDASYDISKELPIINNKIQLEDEILLTDKPMTKTETIYWNWDYRTNTKPEQDVLDSYVGVINGLQELVDEYNTIGTTDARKAELILKMNDKIDTYEAGRKVILPIKVTGVQKYPEGFIVKRIYVTSKTDESYTEGDKLTFAAEFSEGVYADGKQPITAENAPPLKFGFEEVNTASNPIAKVAALINTELKLATVVERTATFVSVDKNIINYEYTIQPTDKGNLKLIGLSGRVCNKKGSQINLDKKDLSGESINVTQINPNLFGNGSKYEWHGYYSSGDGNTSKGTFSITDNYIEAKTFDYWSAYRIETVDLVEFKKGYKIVFECEYIKAGTYYQGVGLGIMGKDKTKSYSTLLTQNYGKTTIEYVIEEDIEGYGSISVTDGSCVKVTSVRLEKVN